MISKINKFLFFAFFIFLGNAAQAQTAPWESILSKDFKVNLDLRNKPISVVARWFSEKSGITIIVNDTYNKNISLFSPAKLNLTEAFSMLETSLNMNKLELVRENKFLVVKPFYKPSYKYYEPIGPVNEVETELKVYYLKNNDASNITKILNEIFGFGIRF